MGGKLRWYFPMGGGMLSSVSASFPLQEGGGVEKEVVWERGRTGGVREDRGGGGMLCFYSVILSALLRAAGAR